MYLKIIVATICISLSVYSHAEEEIKNPKTEEALHKLVDGVKANDKKMIQEGIKEVEKQANNGDSQAAFNLGVYYSMVAKDEENKCKWYLKAAEMDNPDSLPGAIMCSIRKGNNNDDFFVKNTMPLVYKQRDIGTTEDKELAEEIIVEYEKAIKSKKRLTIGDLIDKINALGE